MKPLFSEKDVRRWASTCSEDIEILERRLGRDSNDVQGLNMLALTLVDSAFAKFAIGECDNAANLLQSAVRFKLRIFELHSTGNEAAKGYIRAGEFQTILLAFASGDIDLARQFASILPADGFAVENSPADSSFIYLSLKALALSDFDEAASLLSRPKPEKVDPQFVGYIECLEAIAEKNASKVQVAIQNAESHWYAFMNKKFRGHPQAACFVAGLGFQRIAETTLKTKLDIEFCCSGGSS
jgi:hypothetical protein